MKKECLLLMAITFVAMAVGGCTVAKISGRGVAPILLNAPRGKVELIKHVKVSKMIVFDYTASFDASEILSNVFMETKADAIINTVFTVKTTLADFLVNFITFGIASAKTMEISGDAVKAPQGLGFLPGSEMLEESETLEGLVPTLVQQTYQNGFSNAIVHVQGKKGETLYRLIRYKLDTLED